MCLDFNCFATVRYFFAYYSTGTSLHSYGSSSEKLANFLGLDLHLHIFDFSFMLGGVTAPVDSTIRAQFFMFINCSLMQQFHLSPFHHVPCSLMWV
jgi:hypothetical protein